MGFHWESDPYIPSYTMKNRNKIEETSLYENIWDCLINSNINYERNFYGWEKYTFYIVYNFPNLDIDEIKDDIEQLLSDLHTIKTHENMGIDVYNAVDDTLNYFLDELEERMIKNQIKG